MTQANTICSGYARDRETLWIAIEYKAVPPSGPGYRNSDGPDVTTVLQTNTLCSGHARDTGEPLGSVGEYVQNRHQQETLQQPLCKSTVGRRLVWRLVVRCGLVT